MSQNKVFIIAEAGVNHNGNPDIAKQLVEVAASAGADAVKFQTFKAKTLVHQQVDSAAYQQKNLGKSISQYEMLKSLELARELHYSLQEYCNELHIEFMSTPFDVDSVLFLNQLGIKRFKIGSGDIANAPYLVEIGKCQKQVILSSGMSEYDDIKRALAFISFGGVHGKEPRNLEEAIDAVSAEESKKWLYNNLTLLHCVSEYPTPLERVNLLAIKTLRERFHLRTGLSDHSTSIHVPLVAIGMQASIIEKHFTLDKSMEGPDHKASLDPNELAEMIKRIREVERALGSGEKVPTPVEKETYKLVGKRIVTLEKIKKGDVFNKNNTCTLRADSGISAAFYYDILGKKAQKDYEQYQSIEDDMLTH